MTAVLLFVLYITAQGLIVVEPLEMTSFKDCLLAMELVLLPPAFDAGVRAAMCQEAYVPGSA